MNETQIEIILDLIELKNFPSQGENRSIWTTSGGDGELQVFYDSTQGGQEGFVSCQFKGVSLSVASAFPGVDPLSLPVKDSLSRLVIVRPSLDLPPSTESTF